MKRHISIFAFLLCAFAATTQAQTIRTFGYYTPDGGEHEKSACITLSPRKEMPYPDQVFPGDIIDLSVDFGEMDGGGKGHAVDYWQMHENYASKFEGTKITGSEGKNPYTWTCTNASGTVCFAVKCKYINYNLKYDANGGSSVSGGSHSYPDTYDLAAAPIREGYAFGGWKDGGGVTHAEKKNVSGASFAELDNVHTNGAIVTLKAMWTARNYTVSSEGSNCTVWVAAPSAAYDDDLTISWEPVGGSWKKPTVTVYGGTNDKGTLLATYTTGTSATFNMSETGKGYFENIFIKASYDVFTITYEANGGYFGNTTEFTTTRLIENNTRILSFPDVHWDGDRMSLKGWYRAAGSEIEVNVGDLYDWGMDMTFYAKWNPSDTFIISGTVSPSGGGWITGTNSYVKGKQVTLSANPSNGYSFVEWQRKGQSVSTSAELSVTVEGDAHYTAFFTGNVYTVTFYALDGVPTSQTKDVTFGSLYGSLPTATREGDWELEGWYTAPMGGGVKIEPGTIVNTVGAQMLFSNWKAVPVYSVAFDGNGATSGSMSNQKMYCGVPANLSSNTYERGGWHFRGWAMNAADAAALKIAYEDGELVTDIASTNETVTLYAAWESISLAEAMHCDNLEWTNTVLSGTSTPSDWIVDYGAGRGSNTMSCVTQRGDWLTSCVLTSSIITNNGTISFYWRPEETDGSILFWTDGDAEPKNPPGEYQEIPGTAGVWSPFSADLSANTESERYIHIVVWQGVTTCSVDLMTWTPGGPKPEEKDAVTIKPAAVSDGKFILSFEFDENFDYLLKTNANLLTDSWGVMEVEGKKTDNILTFEPEIIEGQPQMFYRVDTIQKK